MDPNISKRQRSPVPGMHIIEVKSMNIPTELMIPLAEASRDFTEILGVVDWDGKAVLAENDRPRYVVLDFAEYDRIGGVVQLRQSCIDGAADAILAENMEAFQELAK